MGLKIKVVSDFSNDKKNNNVIITKVASKSKSNNSLLNRSVLSKSDNIKGIIRSINNNKCIIEWQDFTKEKILLSSLEEEVQLIDEDVIIEKTYDKINVNELKLEKKINELEKNNKFSKDSTINDLISLSIKKGVIQEDERELEEMKLSLMNEEELNNHKYSLLQMASTNDVGEITSAYEEEIDENLSDAERELIKIKNKLGISSNANNDINIDECDNRSLSEIKTENIPIEAKNIDFKDYFDDFLTNMINDTPNMKKESKKIEKISDSVTTGFQNITGIKKPLNIISNKGLDCSYKDKLISGINALEWTIK